MGISARITVMGKESADKIFIENVTIRSSVFGSVRKHERLGYETWRARFSFLFD